MELVEVTKKTKPAWLTQAVRLERKCFSKSDSLGEQLIKEALKPHNTLVLAVTDDLVQGYILFRRSGTEGHIDRLAVTEHLRRRGLGRSLLQAAIAMLKASRATLLVLEADTANVAAIALYESQGFQRTNVRADYYRAGRDALLMELKL